MPTFEVIVHHPNTWKEAKSIFEGLISLRERFTDLSYQWVFRGQRCAGWTLVSSLEREMNRFHLGIPLSEVEERTYTEFKEGVKAVRLTHRNKLPESEIGLWRLCSTMVPQPGFSTSLVTHK